MNTRVLTTLTALTALALAAPAARAQTLVPRGLVSINGGLQSPSRTFGDTFTFDRYVEQATVRSDYEVKSAPLFDGGFSVRLWGPLGVGVAFARFSHTGTATVEGSIPHPFFFDRGRAISGEVSSVKRNETAVHAQVMAYLPAGSKVLVALFAGPSFLTVEQSLVTRVSYDEAYPFDEATFRSATLTREREKKTGFNAGADVTVMLTRTFGVGGLIRFSQVTVDLPIDGDRTLSVEAGGLQAGGGIRIVF